MLYSCWLVAPAMSDQFNMCKLLLLSVLLQLESRVQIMCFVAGLSVQCTVMTCDNICLALPLQTIPSHQYYYACITNTSTAATAVTRIEII